LELLTVPDSDGHPFQIMLFCKICSRYENQEEIFNGIESHAKACQVMADKISDSYYRSGFCLLFRVFFYGWPGLEDRV